MKIIDRVPEELLDAVSDLSKSLEWGRRLPVYEIHKWWARRYSVTVRLFLAFSELDLKLLDEVSDYRSFVRDLYYNPPRVSGKRLLDPFAGGGTILVEGSVLGYRAIGIEINKLPCLFLESLKVLPSVDLEPLEQGVKRVAELTSDLWRTTCREGHEALVVHTFLAWRSRDGRLQVKVNKIKDGSEKVYFCGECGSLYTSTGELERCAQCGSEFGSRRYDRVDFFELEPYAIEYYCPVCGHKGIKRATPEDVRSYRLDGSRSGSLLRIPGLNETRRLLRAGFRDFAELFTPRQLVTIRTFLEYFRGLGVYERLAKVMVSDAVRSCSILAYYSSTDRRVVPAFVVKSYWLPPQPVELNPLAFKIVRGRLVPLGRGNIVSSLRKMERARDFILEQSVKLDYEVYCGPAQDVLPKMRERFDLVFTDPPYGDYQYYTDMSLLSLSAIGEVDESSLEQLLQKEVTLRSRKDLEKYKRELFHIFYHVTNRLTEDGKLVTTFHHHDESVLRAFLEVFKRLPVRLRAVYSVLGESSGRLTRKRVYLDLVFVFGKRSQNLHYAFTVRKITTDDERIQDLVVKLIDYYEGL